MGLLSSSIILFLLFATSITRQNVELTDCSLFGPVYPMPVNLASSPAIQGAQKTFSSRPTQAIKNGTAPWGPFDSANTSISVGVFSTPSNNLLAKFHKFGSAPRSKAHLTGGKYRTGSVAKLLIVCTFIAIRTQLLVGVDHEVCARLGTYSSGQHGAEYQLVRDQAWWTSSRTSERLKVHSNSSTG